MSYFSRMILVKQPILWKAFHKIGSMTSQVLAIFYLNDLDHFIKEELKIKGYIRYQDDFLLFSESREYLEYCLK